MRRLKLRSEPDVPPYEKGLFELSGRGTPGAVVSSSWRVAQPWGTRR